MKKTTIIFTFLLFFVFAKGQIRTTNGTYYIEFRTFPGYQYKSTDPPQGIAYGAFISNDKKQFALMPNNKFEGLYLASHLALVTRPWGRVAILLGNGFFIVKANENEASSIATTTEIDFQGIDGNFFKMRYNDFVNGGNDSQENQTPSERHPVITNTPSSSSSTNVYIISKANSCDCGNYHGQPYNTYYLKNNSGVQHFIRVNVLTNNGTNYTTVAQNYKLNSGEQVYLGCDYNISCQKVSFTIASVE